MQAATPSQSAVVARVRCVCAVVVLLAGAAALTGWALDIAVLKSVRPSFTAMKPNTALAFLLAGCALVLQRQHVLRLGCAVLVMLLGGLSLAQDVSGVDFGVDQLLFREAEGAVQALRPGRMSPITAANFMLLGGALALLGCGRAARHWVSEALALLALALALPALIGYAYGSDSFYPLRGFGSMALPTALVLPLLSLGILCARADGLAGAFIAPGLSGQIARRLLAMALIAPLLLGALLQFGESTGFFDRTQNIAVFAAAMMMVLVLVSGRLVRALALSDAQGRHAEIARARLAMIVECSDDAIISEAVDGTILSWNAGAERMYGYSAEEVVGRTGALLIPPERWQEEEEVLQRLRRGLAVGTYDTLRLTKAGQSIDVALTLSTLKDAAGQVVGTAKIMRDMGVRNQALLAMHASEERLRLAAEAAEMGIWIWQPDTDSIFWDNRWSALILGIGATDVPVNASRFAAEFVHPDDLASFQQAIAGTVERGERLLFEGRFYRPDRTLRWVEFTGQPQVGPSSPCERIIGTVRDITERKRAEEDLRASEAFSRSILDSSPDCIKVLDLEGHLLSMLSGQQLLGITDIEPFLQKSWIEFWTGEDRRAAQQAVEAAAAGKSGAFIGFFRTLRGEDKWWDVLLTPIPDAEGKPASLLVVSRDATQSRQTEHRLLRQTAELNSLYATAPVGLITFDTRLHYLRINRMMAELHGLPAEQHIGRGLRDLLAPELADAVGAQLHQVLATGRPVLHFEVSGATLPRLSEQRHWLMSCHPVLDEQGGICGVQAAVQDVTELKQAEQLLRQNRDTFFNLIQNAPFGLYIVDAQFRLAQVSTASQKVFVNIHPLIGRDFEEVLRQVWAEPFVSEALGQFRRTLATGQPYVATNTTEQRQNIPEIESYDWKIERVTLPDGQFGVVCYFYDITERMVAEAALRTSEQRLRAFVEASSDALYRMSPDWRVMHELQGQNFINDTVAANANWLQDYIHPEDLARVTAAIDEAIRTKSMFELEHRVLRIDASIGWTLSHAVPLLDASGEITEWFGTASDITDQKRAEAALRESEARYRALFESIDEGFCVIDVLFDEQKKAIDYRFLEVNPAFEKHTGLRAATGKCVLELNPGQEASWFEIYGKVALSGEPIRFTNQAKGLAGRWFDVYAMRLGDSGSSRVALLFRDITDTKRSENDLRMSNEELTVFNLVAVDRELRMIELKREINALCALTGAPARFALASDEPDDTL